jgi:hypothetical protein
VRRSVPAAAFALLFAAACGKVGDPKPPINRTPQSIGDLKASQSGFSLTLVWTNPARYIDNNEATDLAFVRILRNGAQVANEKAGPAGQPQSFEIDVANSLESDLSFAVQVETKRGKMSTLSNEFKIRPVDVPGVPRNLVPLVDQRRIFLTWEPPERNRDLAQGYFVQRSDWPAPVLVTTTRFEDADYEPDKRYEYKVTSVRGSIPGAASVTVPVLAKDETPPATPTGLEIFSAGTGVLLKWNANTERDFKEVLVYRSDRPDEPLFRRSVDTVNDPTYRPGLSYQLQAEDEFGNRSPKSAPQTGP